MSSNKASTTAVAAASAPAAAAAAAARSSGSNDSTDIEYVDVLVDEKGEALQFENDQDEANFLMMMDFAAFLKEAEAKKHKNNEPGDGQNGDDNENGDVDHDEFAHFRAPSAEPIASTVLDFASLFKKMEERTALRDAGELEEEDRVLIEEQRQRREAEEKEEQQYLAQLLEEQSKEAEREQAAAADEDMQEGPASSSEEFADEEGMQQSMMSRDDSYFCREVTDPDQWKLEKILGRKRIYVDEEQEDDADLYEDDETAVGQSVRRRAGGKRRREHTYHCTWHGRGGYTTWELRTDLIELGFKTMVEEFDQKLAAKAVTEKSKRTDFKGPAQYSQFAGFRPGGAYLQRRKAGPEPTVVPLTPEQKFFEDMYPCIQSDIAALFKTAGCMQVDRFVNIAPREPSLRFIKKHGTGIGASRKGGAVLLCHGSPAVEGIMQNGLLVPGTHGIRVANGQAYNSQAGLHPGACAIYTSSSPATSNCYCRGAIYMFICVGVPSPQCVFGGGNVTIFPQAEDIVPVWLVRFGAGCRAVLPVPRRFYRYNEFVSMRFPNETENAPVDNRTEEERELAGLAPAVRKKVIRMRRRQLEYSQGKR